jgi:hypothetical protein
MTLLNLYSKTYAWEQNWDDKHTLIIKLELVVFCFQTLKETGSISYSKNEIIKDHWIKPSNES